MARHITCSHHGDADEHERNRRACVTLVPIFNHLTMEQMEEIMNVVRGVTFKKGEMIDRANEASDSLYIVNRGQVKIYRLAESGKEQLVRILQPGDFTGELALFKQSVHESYAEAVIDTDICVIRRDDLHQLLIRYSAISFKILWEFS